MKMIFFVLFCFCLGGTTELTAQNLISNPSFEIYNACPTGFTSIPFVSAANYPTFNFPTVTSWIRGTINGTPDYFNTCGTGFFAAPGNLFGTRIPHTGNAYGGFWALTSENGVQQSNLEYLQTKLSQSMIAGHSYYLRYYVGAGTLPTDNTNVVAIEKLGTYFSSVQNSANVPFINLTPQITSPAGQYLNDTTGWMKIEGFYTASGGENWVTIGDFLTSSTALPNIQPLVYRGSTVNAAYLYIDDICLVDLINPVATNHALTLCTGDTVSAISSGADFYKWSNGDTTRSIHINSSGLYWVKYVKDCSFFVDTFLVTVFNSQLLNIGNDTSVCQNKSTSLSANHIYNSYLWSNGSTGPSISPTVSGKYSLTVSDMCRTQTDSIYLTFVKTLGPIVNDTAVCQNSTPPIISVIGDHLKWYVNPNTESFSQQPYISTASAGTVTLYVSSTDSCGESDLQQVNVVITPSPTIILDSIYSTCEGQPLTITPQTSNVKSYIWSNGFQGCCPTLARNIELNVSVYNDCGSSDATTKVYFYNCNDCLFVPNAFSPNGDGINDVFVSQSICPMNTFHLQIFNRFGQKVFESFKKETGWDGSFNSKNSDVGTYFFILDYSTTPATQNVITRKGEIALIR